MSIPKSSSSLTASSTHSESPSPTTTNSNGLMIAILVLVALLFYCTIDMYRRIIALYTYYDSPFTKSSLGGNNGTSSFLKRFQKPKKETPKNAKTKTKSNTKTKK